MESDEEIMKKHKKRVQKFWANIEKHVNYVVPSYLKKIFEFSHMDNAEILKGLSYENVLHLENIWNTEGYKAEAESSGNPREFFSNTYHNEKYFFTPGVKGILGQIHTLVKTTPNSFWDIEDEPDYLLVVLSAMDKWNALYERVNETKVRKLSKSSLLSMLVTALSKNSVAKTKEGYRYNNALKLVAGYIYVIGGRILYQNLSANLPLPSVSTATRIVHETVRPINQGECRVDALKNFLIKNKLTKYVWVSEDATRMVPKVQYDSKTNQLVGLVQPTDNKTAFPKVNSFKATNVAAMKKAFESNNVASYLYCYMIQPLQQDAPSFCLSMFGTDSSFTTEDTMKRMDHIIDLLKKNEIIVLGSSGDGDPRIVKAMRVQSRLGQEDPVTDSRPELKIDGFHAAYFPEFTTTQDPVHLATKFKTRLFKTSITLPMGDYIVSATHVKFILENFTKEKHFLTSRHLDGKDKMNFESVIKISSKKVINLLKEAVPGSEATQEYLKIVNFIVYSFLSTELNISLRIYCVWYSIFFIRLWRKWLSKNECYSINNNFVSLNTYLCLEINAHAFLSIVLKTIEDESLKKYLLPWMFGSQPCEGFFRTWRSMSSVFCTAINSSVLEIMRKTQRLEFLSDVMSHDFETETINFPRNTFTNPSFEKIKDSNVCMEEKLQKDKIFNLKLDIQTIKNILDKAKRAALTSIKKLGVKNLKLCDADELSVNPIEIQEDSLYDEQDHDEENEREPNYAESEELVEDEEVIDQSEIFDDLEFRDYSSEKAKVKEDDPYLVIKEKDGSTKTIRKSSICYILSQTNEKLSNDRLIRVQGVSNPNKLDQRQEVTDVVKLDHVKILDWCLFENNETKKCLIGFVLGFAYMDEKIWKKIQFSRPTAYVHTNTDNEEKKRIGVLCNWYGFFNKDKRTLVPAKMSSHGYIDIENYKCTLPTPTFADKKILLDDTVYNKIKDMVMSN